MQKPRKMTETLANGYSSESTQRELSNEYQHHRVKMIFIIFCFFVRWTKVALALEGLIGPRLSAVWVGKRGPCLRAEMNRVLKRFNCSVQQGQFDCYCLIILCLLKLSAVRLIHSIGLIVQMFSHHLDEIDPTHSLLRLC